MTTSLVIPWLPVRKVTSKGNPKSNHKFTTPNLNKLLLNTKTKLFLLRY